MSRIIKIDQDAPRKEDVTSTVNALKNGALIIYPTETIYGLGADCLHQQAISKLYQIKERDAAKPVSFIASDYEMVKRYTVRISKNAERLMEKYWPGPLTVVFFARSGVVTSLAGDRNTIGIRVPAHKLCRILVQQLGRPVTSSSANLSGTKECRTVGQIPGTIRAAADIILDGGITRGRKVSTVISVLSDPPEILREGAVSRHEIEKFLASV